ncbi:MAG: hypothetical protein JWN71_1504 [Xanthobacteraceae bacterium]|nr:hypothetical protein [Xanthobacteraceae bacterium]
MLLCGLMTAGCNTSGQPTASLGTPRGPSASSPSVAFESIDGPPPGVFQKLVQNLNDEATARQLPVVSRQSQASYRIRGYLAAHVANNRTSFAWVWDVYDAEQRRALRISGEVPGRAVGGDAWTGADDEVLRKIAQTGMDRVAAFIASPAAMASAPEATIGGATYAVASANTAPEADALPRQGLARNDDFAPEASGIFRLLRPAEPATPPAAGGTEIAAADPVVPVPRQRPASPARKSTATVTLAAGPAATQD